MVFKLLEKKEEIKGIYLEILDGQEEKIQERIIFCKPREFFSPRQEPDPHCHMLQRG